MSVNGKVINDFIEDKLLNLHTAFLAKVINISDNNDRMNVKVQPLNLIKENGQTAQKQSVIFAPVLKNIKSQIKVNDTVLCICVERNLSSVIDGEFALPPLGHHRMSDAVVIGVL